jgi:uncharacterized protein
VTPTNRTLVIMAKAPRLGYVKTRLADSLSMEAVTELYECLLDDTIALAQTLNNVEITILCPAPDVQELSRSAGKAMRVVAQKGEGLAAGLDSVFSQFATHGQRVIAFNSDSPHLPATVLETAFDALETCDLVVGPTHDGGYYLVGARRAHPDLFINDGMGTTNALQALLRRAKVLGLSISLTDRFYDIDELTDLRQIAEELRKDPERAPRTAKWVSAWARARARNQGAP